MLDQTSTILSIVIMIRRRPSSRLGHTFEIDSVEEHGELAAVELGARRFGVELRHFEATALEPLVDQNEPAAIPVEELGPVQSASKEEEDVSGVWVEVPNGLHQRE